MPRPLLSLALALALLAATAVGCGGNDPKASDSGHGSSTAASSTSASASASASGDPRDNGLVVTDGITPAKLIDCLTAAGLKASTDDATMLGLDADERDVRVDDMEGFDGPGSQGADLYVFTDPAAARANASAVTLGGTDDSSNSRFAVAGNVVRDLDIIIGSTPTADETALLGCLPA